jgi:hypothetical protein
MKLSAHSIRPLGSSILSFIAISALAISASARPIPQNLGSGLDKLVESHQLLNAGAPAAFAGEATKAAASYAPLAMKEKDTGRVLIDVVLNGRVPFEAMKASLGTQFSNFKITNVDAKYRKVGVIEGYASLDDMPALANMKGVGSVSMCVKPRTNVGAVTGQGIHQHRVNQVSTLYNAGAVSNYDGTGISIGVMSDSFDVAAQASTRATADVATGDLPGAANPVNTQPVVVLEDLTGTTAAQTGTDEGRGMCQIVHDVAPKSRIGFATAFGGEVGFANNIRALAALPGYEKDSAIQQGFAAHVICDDVSYLNEPMFQDGIIAQAVNQVVAAGKTYCSSAANNWGTDGYASVLRPVANGSGLTSATNAALAGTNINLAGVDPALYAGGFHNFNPAVGQLDVAQLVNSNNDASFVCQWNDAYDTADPVLGSLIFSDDGTSTPITPDVTFTGADGLPPFTQGQEYVIDVTQTSLNFDAIVEVIDPNGHSVLDQDTGIDERVVLFAPITGQYSIRVHPFETSAGGFHIEVHNANGVPKVTTDWNVLFFDTSGNFIQSLSSNNIANNRPIELGQLSLGLAQVQMVISRANTPSAPQPATQIKYVFFGNGLDNLGPAEYNNYLTPVTFGHSAAAGANSVAAYEVFRSNIPEAFTSPGPVTIYFDPDSNPLATPEIRQKPDIAAADGVNNTFFPIGGVPGVTDSLSDPDTFPNFSGTSAASPHCAALAALVLQAHGGGTSLTPAQVKEIFQRTAFPHDLDPYSVTGTATVGNGGKVTIKVVSDDDINPGTGSNDSNACSVSYTGPGQLVDLHFNPDATAATAGNTTGGNFLGFTPADFLDPTKYNSTPGMIFSSTFLFGTSTGVNTGDVTHTVTNQAPVGPNTLPSSPRYWTLNLAFANNSFTTGDVFRFNMGRYLQQNAYVPLGFTIANYTADLLGGSVQIPEDPNGTQVKQGMSFSGTIKDGAVTYPFSGRLTNRIGHGYSPLDGYGFINVQAAVAAPVGLPTSVRLVNISGRVDIEGGDNVGIAGFIISGSGSRRLMIRGLGPSLPPELPNRLADPFLHLHTSDGGLIVANDNWRNSQETEIEQTGFAPSSNNESAIAITLAAGRYTAILEGVNGSTGTGLIEVYDLDVPNGAEVANLSVRALVGTGDNVLIDGVIIGPGDPGRMMFRALGPSLAPDFGAGALQDPFLELHDSNGALIASNDDWQLASNAIDIALSGLAPSNVKEPAILTELPAGLYTLIVTGVNQGTGTALNEIYKLE